MQHPRHLDIGHPVAGANTLPATSRRGNSLPTTLYCEGDLGLALPVTFMALPVSLFHSTFELKKRRDQLAIAGFAAVRQRYHAFVDAAPVRGHAPLLRGTVHEQAARLGRGIAQRARALLIPVLPEAPP